MNVAHNKIRISNLPARPSARRDGGRGLGYGG